MALVKEKIRITLLLAAVVVNFVILVSPGFDSPAHFYYDEDMLAWASAGIADIVWGLGVTKGQIAFFTSNWADNIFNLTRNPDALNIILEKTRTAPGPVFLGRYPPGIGLTLYVAFTALGLHFWVVRLAPTIFHIGTLVLFTLNLKRFNGSYSSALLGGLLFSTVPMSSYFGRLADGFIPALFFMTLAATFYSAAWDEKSAMKRLFPTTACVCLAMFYNWVGLILAVTILGLELRRNQRSLEATAAYGAVILAALAVLVIPLVITGVSVGNSQGTGVIENLQQQLQLFVHRTFLTTVSDNGQPITLTSWIESFVGVNEWGFTPFLPVLAIGGFFLWVRKGARMIIYSTRVNCVLCLVGVTWTILMAQGVFVHMYYQYFLLPGEVYFASAFLERIASIRRFRIVGIIAVTAVILAVYYYSRVYIYGGFLPS
jgi:hypothetical protein